MFICICEYVYMYMYRCIYVHMYICIHVYTYICIYVCIYIHIDIYNAESNRPNRCITLLVGIFLWMLHENGPTKPLSPPFCNRRQDIQGSKWEITTAWVTWSWFWRQWDLSCLGVKSELFTGNVFFCWTIGFQWGWIWTMSSPLFLWIFHERLSALNDLIHRITALKQKIAVERLKPSMGPHDGNWM